MLNKKEELIGVVKILYQKKLSLMMALSERCPNAWHMLIERLILLYNYIRILVVVYRWVMIN